MPLSDPRCSLSISKVINDYGVDYTTTDYWEDYKEGISKFCPQSRQYVVWKVAKENTKLYNQMWESFTDIWSHPPLTLMKGIKEVLLSITRYD